MSSGIWWWCKDVRFIRSATCSITCRKPARLMSPTHSQRPGPAIRPALARRRLKTLLQWLERNGENGAAASLREGMEETLTVLKLELPTALRGFLVTTNAIENLIGSARRTSRNVTRWRSGDMISRWAAVGLLQAEEHFRRIRGYRHLPLLKRALRADVSKLDATEEAA